MSISIYLSNSNVQIAVGSGTKENVAIQKIHSVDIQEGSLLNGVITSENELSRELVSIWERFHLPKKGVRLIIDSTQFFTKVVKLPKMNEKKTRELLKNEFQDLENPEQYLYDYRVLPTEEKGAGLINAICAAVPKEFIDGYIHLFETMQVSLDGIDVSLNGRLKVFYNLMDLRDRTFISVLLDGSNLTSTLFADGAYKYLNRSRIFSEHGTEDFGLEVAKTISSIMQFHASEKIESPIECVYMGGFEASDYKNCIESIGSLGLPAGKMEEPNTLQLPSKENIICDRRLATHGGVSDFIYLIGNMVAESRDINFCKRIERLEKEKPSTFRWKTMVPLFTVLGVCIILSAALIGMNLMKAWKIDEADKYLKNKSNTIKQQEALEIESKLSEQSASIETGELGWKVIKSFPIANSNVQNTLLNCAGTEVAVTVDGYDAVTGIYEFTAMASDVTKIYDFINQLKETGVFADLEYSGYNYTSETDKYDIQVSGYLNESAGK